jgi:hypothetical protein
MGRPPEYHDSDLFTPAQAKAECDKCRGPCATGCRWFWATHTNAQRIAAMKQEADKCPTKSIGGIQHGSGRVRVAGMQVSCLSAKYQKMKARSTAVKNAGMSGG